MAEDTSIELAQEIDPNGVLNRMANNTLIHMDDNIMQYYKAAIENGKKQWAVMWPPTECGWHL